GPQRTVPAVGLNSPYGLAFDPAGALYVADFNNDRVVKLPVRGGQRTVPVAGLRTPAGLAIPSERAGY
ncbi:NHL repeat-containing protein, partial [Streptomyces sp. Termitarium-T10T-6]